MRYKKGIKEGKNSTQESGIALSVVAKLARTIIIISSRGVFGTRRTTGMLNSLANDKYYVHTVLKDET